MKQYFSYIVLGSSALLFFVTFFASDSVRQLESLRMQRDQQEREKQKVVDRVTELRTTLVGMDENPRTLEKLAREQLNVAREDELIILFDKP